jgi:hypothetical protein
MVRARTARISAALSIAAMALTISAGSVFAGEITGNGKSLEPLHAKSICAYSGLNDKTAGEGPVDERVQSYGWVVRDGDQQGGTLRGIPGQSCRGNLGGG